MKLTVALFAMILAIAPAIALAQDAAPAAPAPTSAAPAKTHPAKGKAKKPAKKASATKAAEPTQPSSESTPPADAGAAGSK